MQLVVSTREEVLLGQGKKWGIYVNGKYLITVGNSQKAEAIATVLSGKIDEGLKLHKSLQGVILKRLDTLVKEIKSSPTETIEGIIIDEATLAYEASDLSYNLAKYILPRLQWLQAHAEVYPDGCNSLEEWKKILEDMQLVFKADVAYNEEANFSKTNEECQAIAKKSFDLFSKYYFSLWD